MNDDVNIFELYVENAKQQKSPTMFVDDKGTKRWRLHGKLHRVDGPAVEYANGGKSWWIGGRLYSNYDLRAWAIAALEFEGKDINVENVEQKIQQAMQQDLFN